MARATWSGYRALGAAISWVACVLAPGSAGAFTHIVQPGETLASIAEKFYGKIQHEKILVAGNALDAQGGSPIVPGMRLEVPTLSYRRVRSGDTWPKLAADLLGSSRRSDVLATANDSKPWLPPDDAAQIVVPYNLTLIVGPNENIVSIAFKFMGNTEKAWVLDYYNGFKGRRLLRGDVVLVPLTDLELTEEGKHAASAANATNEGAHDVRQSQRRVHAELPALIADVRGGRYADAVTRGSRFLAAAELTEPQLAAIHRQLLEAYVALDAVGLATASCNEWRKHDANARLDPALLSPKIIAACERGMPSTR
jgi:hypothetical protein